jgi:hypothetical protein
LKTIYRRFLTAAVAAALLLGPLPAALAADETPAPGAEEPAATEPAAAEQDEAGRLAVLFAEETEAKLYDANDQVIGTLSKTEEGLTFSSSDDAAASGTATAYALLPEDLEQPWLRAAELDCGTAYLLSIHILALTKTPSLGRPPAGSTSLQFRTTQRCLP